jgi:hypothetical protein
MGIYTKVEDAKAEARLIHESDEDDEFYIPVWVRACTYDDEGARMWEIGMFPDRTTNETPGRWVSATTRDGKPRKNYPSPKGLGWVFPGKTKVQKLRQKEAAESDPDPTYRVTYNLGVDLKLDVEAPRSATARAWGDEIIGGGFKGTLDNGRCFEAIVLHGDRVACEKVED